MGLLEAAVAVNRFGLGARNQDLRSITSDPRGWLKSQLQPERVVPPALAALPPLEEAATAFSKWLQSIGADAVGEMPPGGPRQMAPMTTGVEAKPGMGVEQSYAKYFGPSYAAAVSARFSAAETSERPFFERLVRFWSNHFTVSATKPSVIALAPLFERDAIRPHVTGKFPDMLLAVCRHSAMLTYLDNYISIGPNSYLAKNPSVLPENLRPILKGLNENLAREILELHTMGVRGGYTQADVTSLAKIITGWGYYGPKQRQGSPGRFRFLEPAHEPGAQTLLGKTYPQSGEAQGDAALRDLALHPTTADHLAGKLTRHFVADVPPPRVVEAVAQSLRNTGGDLAAAASVLIDAPEAWSAKPAKYKQPEEFLLSTVRGLGAPKLNGQQLVALLDRMGQRPYWAPAPDGWPDSEDGWIGADAVWKRLEWANAIAKGLSASDVDPVATAERLLGPQLSSKTRDAIRAAENPAQGLAIFLASPEFQRR